MGSRFSWVAMEDAGPNAPTDQKLGSNKYVPTWAKCQHSKTQLSGLQFPRDGDGANIVWVANFVTLPGDISGRKQNKETRLGYVRVIQEYVVTHKTSFSFSLLVVQRS